jgi:ubiquinone/menaquinone biosynthesis C-methylase UbiE
VPTSDPKSAVTERVRAQYDESASSYDRRVGIFDRLLFGGGREWVCSQADGDVLEIAIGTGRNLSYYPTAARVTGVELSPAMLEIARRRAEDLGRTVDLRLGDAQRLDFPDESFDAVVCTLSLCTIPDDRAAVAEARRVLKPGGRFLALEHVRSPISPIRLAQRILDPLAVRLQSDHLLREPLEHFEALGLEVERVERLKAGIVERVAARKPGPGYRSHRQTPSADAGRT